MAATFGMDADALRVAYQLPGIGRLRAPQNERMATAYVCVVEGVHHLVPCGNRWPLAAGLAARDPYVGPIDFPSGLRAFHYMRAKGSWLNRVLVVGERERLEAFFDLV